MPKLNAEINEERKGWVLAAVFFLSNSDLNIVL